MRKIVIMINSIALCILICIFCYLFFRYHDTYSKVKNKKIKINKVEEKIKVNDENINEVKTKISNFEKENSEKVDLVKLWEKELKKVKEHS